MISTKIAEEAFRMKDKFSQANFHFLDIEQAAQKVLTEMLKRAPERPDNLLIYDTREKFHRAFEYDRIMSWLKSEIEGEKEVVSTTVQRIAKKMGDIFKDRGQECDFIELAELFEEEFGAQRTKENK